MLSYLRVDGIPVASSVAGQADERDESVDLRGTVVARLPGDTRLRVGDRLPVTLHLDALSLFDADSGESLLKPS